jgi:hypothetical protein
MAATIAINTIASIQHPGGKRSVFAGCSLSVPWILMITVDTLLTTQQLQ